MCRGNELEWRTVTGAVRDVGVIGRVVAGESTASYSVGQCSLTFFLNAAYPTVYASIAHTPIPIYAEASVVAGLSPSPSTACMS